MAFRVQVSTDRIEAARGPAGESAEADEDHDNGVVEGSAEWFEKG